MTKGVANQSWSNTWVHRFKVGLVYPRFFQHLTAPKMVQEVGLGLPTSPSGQMKVRLKATGGAGSRSGDRRSGGPGGGGTLAAETNVADEDVAGDVHGEDVLSREDV